jgi:hypothetical protein
MRAPYRRRGAARWMVGLVAGLVVAGLPGWGHGLERPAPPAGEICPATRLPVAVRQGQLAAHLWEMWPLKLGKRCGGHG